MRIKLFAALFALTLLAFNSQAQVKIGYTNIDFLLANVPDAKEIQNKLAIEKQQYEKLLQEKYAEFQKSLEDYQKNAPTMNSVIKQDKEKSLQLAQESIQELQQNSEAAIQKKQNELLAPVMDKIQKAIDDVAKENAYTYILNLDAGFGTMPVILYAPEENNITNLVFKKLGVTPPSENAASGNK